MLDKDITEYRDKNQHKSINKYKDKLIDKRKNKPPLRSCTLAQHSYCRSAAARMGPTVECSNHDRLEYRAAIPAAESAHIKTLHFECSNCPEFQAVFFHRHVTVAISIIGCYSARKMTRPNSRKTQPPAASEATKRFGGFCMTAWPF